MAVHERKRDDTTSAKDLKELANNLYYFHPLIAGKLKRTEK
jgi:hypothetical protein